MQKELQDKNLLINRISRELDETKQNLDNINSCHSMKFNEDINLYRQRALDAEKSLREQEEMNSINESRSVLIIEKLKETMSQTIDQLEDELNNERNKHRMLSTKASLVLSQYNFD